MKGLVGALCWWGPGARAWAPLKSGHAPVSKHRRARTWVIYCTSVTVESEGWFLSTVVLSSFYVK